MDINGGDKNRVFHHDFIKITEGTVSEGTIFMFRCDSSGCQLIFLRISPMIFLGIQECKVLLYILWEVIAKIAAE